MKIPGIGRLKRTVKKLSNKLAPGGLILMYHRVAEVSSDPFKLCVTPRHFSEHLEVLKKHSQPIALRRLVQTLQDGKSPHRGVGITFDDGYADNLHHAKPLLEQYDIPATVFITTENLAQEREFWWDELERLILQPGNLPKNLNLTIKDRTYQWDLGEAACYQEESYQRDRPWNWYLSEEADPSSRQQLYRSLYQVLQPLLSDERQQKMDQLLVWSGTEAKIRATHRSLYPKEVMKLVEGGLIEVGAHTVTHPFLSKLSVSFQQQEIKQSKVNLEELIDAEISSFAYPHGNYNEITIDLVREAGFASACSTKPNKIRGNIDLFQLPRFEVQNWDGEEFAQRLSRWLYE